MLLFYAIEFFKIILSNRRIETIIHLFNITGVHVIIHVDGSNVLNKLLHDKPRPSDDVIQCMQPLCDQNWPRDC